MVSEANQAGTGAPAVVVPRPKPRRRSSPVGPAILAVLLMLVGLGAWAGVARPEWLFGASETVKTVSVDRGEVRVFVVESGTLENSDNATVRCEVEALLGTVGGTGSAMGGMGGGAGGGGRGGAGGGGARGGRGGGMSAGGGAARVAGAAGGAGGGARAGGAGAGGAAGGAGGAGGGGMGGAAGAGAGAAGAATASVMVQRPVISSFSYVITPHVPLRPMLANMNQASTINAAMMASMQQNQRGGGNQSMGERAGSTRILKILDEGQPVREGDIVCWLDSSAFRDELAEQAIKWTQAKSWVEQAEKALEVAHIALEEYEQGVYPRDLELVENYIRMCQVQRDQSELRLQWAQEMVAKGLQTDAQARSAGYEFQRTDLALQDAFRMKRRLVEFAMPKVIAGLKAKLASVESDLQAQRAAFTLEDQRKNRLEAAIANCEMRAPRDGMVVYVNQANRWGQVDSPIEEGATVRQNQAIFQIPNSDRMKVRARVNESKVNLITAGTPALIRAEAKPDMVLRGTVETVTVIPIASSGPISDVKVYYADIELDENGDYEGLRPGMTARVEFLVNTRKDVTRVPLSALRWFGGEAYAALAGPDGGHAWSVLKLGVRDEYFAEVLSGLEPGQRLIADPAGLAPPVAPRRTNRATVNVQADSESARDPAAS